MDDKRRHSDSGEEPSTSKEINSELEKTNGPRDMVKDAYKKLEAFKHEKLQLEKAWKEQKERNEDLTRHIKIDNWDQSVERLRAYIEIFQYKIHDLSIKVPVTTLDIQEHNLSSRSFQQSLRKQVGYLSEQSFQKCLQEGDLEKAREHIEKLKAINEEFRDSLVELGVTLTAESKSIDKENQQLEQEIDEIKPKDVKLSRLTRIKDALIGPHEHRPERVNNIIAKFKEHVKYIKEQIDSDSLPEDLKGKLIEMTLSLIQDFKKFSAQAVHGYGEGSKGRQSRQEGEESVKDLHQIIQKLNRDLEKRKKVHEFQAKLQNDPVSTSDDVLPHLEQLVADKVIASFDHAHNRILQYYQKFSTIPSIKTFFPDAYQHLEKAYNRFLIFRNLSDKWRQVHKDQIGIEATHIKGTDGYIHLQKLAIKEINAVKDIYNGILALYQKDNYSLIYQADQANHIIDDIRENDQRFQEACDRVRTLHDCSKLYSDKWNKIHELNAELEEAHSEHTPYGEDIKSLSKNIIEMATGAYKDLLALHLQGKDPQEIGRASASQHFQKACDQFETLCEASHAWKQVHEIQEKFVEVLSGLDKDDIKIKLSEFDKDFEQLLNVCDQENDWQDSKQFVKENYQRLKDIVKDGLRKKWDEHEEYHKNLLERLLKKVDPTISDSSQEEKNEQIKLKSSLKKQKSSFDSQTITPRTTGVDKDQEVLNRYREIRIDKRRERFNRSLDEENFSTAYEYIKKIEDSNENFNNYLQGKKTLSKKKIGFDTLEDIRELNNTETKSKDHIESKNDTLTLERGQGKYEQFNTLLKAIDLKLGHNYDLEDTDDGPRYGPWNGFLPKEVENKFIEIVDTFSHQFQEVDKQARDSSNGETGREAINRNEQKINALYTKMNEMSRDLYTWMLVHHCRKQIVNSSISSFRVKDFQTKFATAVKAYNQVLDCYQQDRDWSLPKQRFEEACKKVREETGKIVRLVAAEKRFFSRKAVNIDSDSDSDFDFN